MEASILDLPQHRCTAILSAEVRAPVSRPQIDRSRWSVENQDGELLKHTWADSQFLDSARNRTRKIPE